MRRLLALVPLCFLMFAASIAGCGGADEGVLEVDAEKEKQFLEDYQEKQKEAMMKNMPPRRRPR